MSSPRHLAESAPVLRDIAVHEHPHTLTRPRHLELLRTAHVAGAADAPPEEMTSTAQAGTYEEGFAAGRVEGIQIGRSTGRAEQRAEGEASLKEEAAVARLEACEQGYAEGISRADEESRAAAERLRADLEEKSEAAAAEYRRRMEQVLQGIEAQHAAALALAEEDMVAMVYEAVCQILGESAANPETIRGMIGHLRSHRERQPVIAVHVHPDDLVSLELEAATVDSPSWKWVADDSIELGGILMRSADGSLDARLDTQLKNLARLLLQERTRRQPGVGKASTDVGRRAR